jgi:hypothetical protein
MYNMEKFPAGVKCTLYLNLGIDKIIQPISTKEEVS